ncbi:FRG domain-containing protein [Candidatus Electronema sp. TJ]|uniref:FRG domain-containing protein n=1 Tax=Candidatus Electronema sp. TJ TaxID=3401573 RepID=UPI003AA82962
MGQTISSMEGFTRKIGKILPAADEVLAYRGHSDRQKFKLLPSVLRDPTLAANEHAILRELVASHPIEFAQDSTTLEQLARAQHYSLPTRLLDVTWNPLVALYFACKKHDDTPGEVIVFRVKRALLKFYDSDTVSCIANLAHLKKNEQDAIDFSLSGPPFNMQSSVARLLQFIKVEKPHFLAEIVPDNLKTVLCVKPKRNSQRILVQCGAFLLFGIFGDLDSNSAHGISIERIQVNGKKKKNILFELDRVAINDSSMFPEIDQAATYIRSKYEIPVS